MKKSTKAVLLSALVFPGSGHIYLKRYVAGAVLVSASFAVIIYTITKTTEKALSIADKIQNGNVPLDIEAITELVSKQSSGSDILLLNIATTALIVFWIIGVFDSFRVGCKRNEK